MFKDVVKAINQANNILILTHINPDGDALGSTLGFKCMLNALGKKADILLEKKLPEMFSVFGDEYLYGEYSYEYDLVCVLDCADLSRLGETGKYFKGKTLCIDHHVSSGKFADINYVDSKAAATGEIVYDLLKYMNLPVDKKMASALYGAILTDTGGFMFSNTTKKTHDIAGELILNGANYYTLNKKLIGEKDYKRHLITAECIKRMEFLCDGKICVVIIPSLLAKELDIKDYDLNGLAQVPRTVSGVEVGVLISELEEGIIKVSLRSDELVDVSKIAEKFGGGGHIRASGIRIKESSVEKVKKDLIKEIKKQFKEDR